MKFLYYLIKKHKKLLTTSVTQYKVGFGQKSVVHVMLYVSKGVPPQAEVALGVPGRLRLRIFSTFGTTRVGGRQPNAPAAFTPGEIPGTHYSTSGHMVLSEGTTEKIPRYTTGDRSRDRPTSSAAP